MDNKPARYLRLKDSHPTMQKLDQLFALAEELGINIGFSGYGVATIEDRDRDKDLPPLRMQDIENSDYPMDSFPPTLDFKVIYENPEHIEMERLAHEAYKEQERLKAEAKSEAAKRSAETRKKEQRTAKIAALKAQADSAMAELKKLQEPED